MAPRLRWQDPPGIHTVSAIVKKLIPQWKNGLYPAQQKLIVRILDGEDLVCCMATGGGKSALFAVPMVILLEMARNPALYPDLPTRALPVGIVVTPTKGLAANIVLELKKLDVSAFAYCHDTVTAARQSGRNLAQEIAKCTTWNVVCVDPEHLRDKNWRIITGSDTFRANIVYGCVDEAHLIKEWGAEFRPQFQHIGSFFRGRLPSSTSIMALSATIQPGPALKSICSSLGMSGDDFYLFRMSNERPNTQLIFEPLENGVGGKIFPQLLRILNSGRKAVIHCRTIDDVLRVFLYLWKSLPPGQHRLRRLKMYHSLRSSEDNEEILRLLDEDPLCQVVIATIAFANGLNVKSLLDSISLGFPDTVDQLWQEKGRVGRNPETAARGIVLYQPSVRAAAEKQLAGLSSSAPNSKSKPRSPKALEPAKVQVLTEKTCLNAAFNHVYQNPPLNLTGLDCIAANRRFPCGLCAARAGIVLEFPAPPLPRGTHLPPFTAPLPVQHGMLIDKKLKLTAKERAQAEPELLEFGHTVRRAERKNMAHINCPNSAFFPPSLIRSLLDALLSVTSFNDIVPLLVSWKFASGNRVRLYAVVHQLRTTIIAQREEAQVKKTEARRQKSGKGRRRQKTAVWDRESDEDGEDEVSGGEMDGEGNSSEKESSDEEVDPHPRSSPIPPPPKRPRRILNEVTNERRSARTQKAAPRKLQTAAEVSQTYSAPYRTSRRRALDP